MASEQPKGAAPKPAPYPKNWGQMTAGQKRQWQDKNGVKPAPHPVQPPKQHAPRPAEPQVEVTESYDNVRSQQGDEPGVTYAEPPSGGAGVRFTIQVGEREPVDACPSSFLPTLLRELAESYEQPPEEPQS